MEEWAKNSHGSKKNKRQMIKKHMKRCLALFITKDM